MHSTGSGAACKVQSEGIVFPDDQLMKELLGCGVVILVFWKVVTLNGQLCKF